MKKNVLIELKNYSISLITNGKEDFENIVICFHGFNGDKWGDAFGGLKNRLANSLVVSFDSCGHGESEISSLDMRLNVILNEIDVVVNYFKKEVPNKAIILIGVSYGAYRIMQFLIKYKPDIEKIILVNPAFKMLNILESIKNFKYDELKVGDKIIMKKSLNKYMSKDFLDDIYKNSLFDDDYKIDYDIDVIVGTRDTLIPIQDTIDFIEKYGCRLTYIDEDHYIENKENWNTVVDLVDRIS